MMTPYLACEEQTLWRNLHAPGSSVPFIECGEALTCIRRRTGRLDERTLQDMVARLVERHAVLRSRFPADGGGAVRHSLATPRRPVSVFDFSDLPPDERYRHAARVVHAGLCAPFDVAAGPLFRVASMTLDREQHVLALAAHHIVFDVTSTRTVAGELDACLAGNPVAVPPETAPYSDYVLRQRTQLAGATFERLRTYWMRTLDGLIDRRLALPGSHDVPSTRSRLASFAIDAEETIALRQLSKRLRVSLATMTLGLFAVVLHEMTDSADVAIGMPVSCRPAKEFENTVGLFVNVVAIRSDVSDTSGFSRYLGRLWSAVIDAYQHRAFPYECLVDALGARTGQGPPPFRVVFSYSVPSAFDLAPPEFPNRETSHNGPPSFADLSLHARDRGTSLDCGLVYKTDLFDESVITDLTTRFRRLAREVVRNPDRSVTGANGLCWPSSCTARDRGPSMDLVLRVPRQSEEAEFLRAHRATSPTVPHFLHHYEEGMPFQRYLELLAEQERGDDLAADHVPSTFLFAFAGTRIVGRVAIRHALTPHLERLGGHIGYAVVPEFRRQGYATAILRQSLQIARQKLGLTRVLVTCDDDNVGSIRTIEKNGGVLENIVAGADGDKPKRRYWITRPD
jgi:predicted acetyltransferase